MDPKVKRVNESGIKKRDKPKKERKAITVSLKVEVIKRIEEGQRNKEVAQALNLPPSTVRTIYVNREKIMKTAETVVGGTNLKTVSMSRHPLMEKLEKLLIQWIEDQTKRNMTLSFLLIREKALSLFDYLKKAALDAGDETVTNLDFKGSHGWFDRFKKRGYLHNLKVTGESASADTAAANVFPDKLKKIIEERGYINKQIFNIDETGLFWKRMMSRTFISRDEKQAKGHKVSKDRLTLLVGGNAEGDVKLKPLLVYQSENPRALKGVSKVNLPVIWRSNKKAWVTQQVFFDYVQNYFCPFVEKYCKKNNISNKAMLIIDNAPGHPATVVDYGTNVQVVFLPPNTTSLLQPMDQGIIATFKAYYLQLVMKYLVDGLDKSDKLTIKDLWKNYNIKVAVENIGTAWDKVTAKTMNAVWRKLLPQAVHNTGIFETTQNNIQRDIVRLAAKAGFDEVDDEDVQQVLDSHDEELTNEELMQREEESLQEEGEQEEEVIKDLDTKQLRKLFSLVDDVCAFLDTHDGNLERVWQAKIGIKEKIQCYRVLYDRKMSEAKQPSILSFFQSAIATNSQVLEPQPSCSGISHQSIRLEEEETDDDLEEDNGNN